MITSLPVQWRVCSEAVWWRLTRPGADGHHRGRCCVRDRTVHGIIRSRAFWIGPERVFRERCFPHLDTVRPAFSLSLPGPPRHGCTHGSGLLGMSARSNSPYGCGMLDIVLKVLGEVKR